MAQTEAIIRGTYESGKRAIVLTSKAATPAWARFRRLFEDHTNDAEDLGPLALRIPFWRFLSLREEADRHALRLGLRITLDSRLNGLLENSTAASRSYRDAIQQKLVPLADIESLLSNTFRRELTAEQKRNLGLLLSRGNAASFSVPGAGKTTEALAYIFASTHKDLRLLVVAPKNAFAVWEEELANCAPGAGFSFVRLTGGEDAIRTLLGTIPRAMLITYQQFAIVVDLLAEYLGEQSTTMILDESHRVKRGQSGVIGRAILSVAHLPALKLILSGTPMPNSLADLIPQLRFLYPELEPSAEAVGELIQPIYARTTKSELHVPPITRRQTSIPMTEPQRRLYTLLCSELAREAENALRLRDRVQLRSLGNSVMRLLQLVSNPALLAPSISEIHSPLLREILSDCDSPKIEYVCNRARELVNAGRKVVIWSTFVANVELLASRLIDLGADYIHGGVEAGSEEESNTREAKLARFKSSKNAWVLVANPAACSEGISLHTVCHEAIYLDRNFNAAQYLQSEDRIHRFGLADDVVTNVEIVYVPESIDEVVDSRLRHKVRQMGEVLNDRSLNIDPVTTDLDEDGLNDEDLLQLASHVVQEAHSQ